MTYHLTVVILYSVPLNSLPAVLLFLIGMVNGSIPMEQLSLTKVLTGVSIVKDVIQGQVVYWERLSCTVVFWMLWSQLDYIVVSFLVVMVVIRPFMLDSTHLPQMVAHVNGRLIVFLCFYLSSGAQLDSIAFVLTSDPAALSVTFSLTCTSTGGPINTMQWEKDGVLVPDSNIYPELTDRSTASYTNILQVVGMQPGLYTCTATDGGATDGGATLSPSQSITVEGILEFGYNISNNYVIISVLHDFSCQSS